MESNLASARDGISERLVPEQDQGRMIDAERVSRYQWAAQVASGRSVLDAGCGTGYGSRLLAAAGAREVVGVDIAGSVLETAAREMPESVRLQLGDVRRLDFEDHRFELVVCFELLERVDDPLAVLDELVRVLAPGGLLLVSSPGGEAHPPGDPHHLQAFGPGQLEEALAGRLRHVRLLGQHDYVASAVVSVDAGQQDARWASDDIAVHELAADGPGDLACVIAMASDAELPRMRDLVTMGGTAALREWLSALEIQAARIAEKDGEIDDLQARMEERNRLTELLGEAEQRLAQVPELNQRIADLELELAEARSAADAARREADQLDRMLMYGRRMLRFVRPLIKPLRRVRRMLRG